MPFVIVCPHCSASLRGDPDLVGEEVECPRCHETFRAVAPGARPAPSPPRSGKPRGGAQRPLFVKPPPPAVNPWLLLALLLGGTVAVGTAILFGISALIPGDTNLGSPDPAALSQRGGDGGPRNDAPSRLPPRVLDLPKTPENSPSPPSTSQRELPNPPLAPADDGLSVTSTPPDTVRKGETMRYQIRVRSRNGGVRYRLVSGPEGMRILTDGEVVWRVPNSARPEQKVNVVVTDVDGNRIAHRFTLKVLGAGASKD